MAGPDILNTDGTSVGIRRGGRIRVFHPGDITVEGRLGETYDPEDALLVSSTGTLDSISGIYEERWDEIRYYVGDTSS